MNGQTNITDQQEFQDYNRLAYFRRFGVQPPGALYITVDDVFQVTITSPVQSVAVNVSMRLLTAEGNVVPIYYPYPLIPLSSNPTRVTIPGVEGYLLSLTVDAPTVPRGSTYVVVSVRRGLGTGDTAGGELLCEGYPGGLYLLNYPFTMAEAPNAGPGMNASHLIGTVTAGLDWSTTVPSGQIWQLGTVTATLTTGAAVANRAPALVILDPGGNVIVNAAAAYVQAASLVWSYSWSVGGTAPPSGTSQNGGAIPAGLRLFPASIIKTVTANLQAADQWTVVNIFSHVYPSS